MKTLNNLTVIINTSTADWLPVWQLALPPFFAFIYFAKSSIVFFLITTPFVSKWPCILLSEHNKTEQQSALVQLHLFHLSGWYFPLWINMQCCYVIVYCCKVHVELFHVQYSTLLTAICAPPLSSFVAANQIQLCWAWWKNVFLSQTLPW